MVGKVDLFFVFEGVQRWSPLPLSFPHGDACIEYAAAYAGTAVGVD